MTGLTHRELRIIRKEYRKTIKRAGYLARLDCALLSNQAMKQADALAARADALAHALKEKS